MFLRTFPGQINDIKELVSQVQGDDLILVEIGSYRGESMEIFAESNKFKTIYCIDPWESGFDEKDMCDIAGFAEIEKTFDEKANKFNFIKKIKNKSFDASKHFEDESIDIVYIDGMHTPEALELDIKTWLPKLKKTGYITGHDWHLKDGFLQNTIKKMIGQPDYICEHVKFGGNSDGSWLKRKNNIT